MAESVEPVGAIALDSRLVEEAGYSDDSTAKPTSRKKKTTRNDAMVSRQRVDIVAMINANYLSLLKELPHNYI